MLTVVDGLINMYYESHVRYAVFTDSAKALNKVLPFRLSHRLQELCCWPYTRNFAQPPNRPTLHFEDRGCLLTASINVYGSASRLGAGSPVLLVCIHELHQILPVSSTIYAGDATIRNLDAEPLDSATDNTGLLFEICSIPTSGDKCVRKTLCRVDHVFSKNWPISWSEPSVAKC